MSSNRPRITCHVLDTHGGAPAPSIPVTLTLLSPTVKPFATFPTVFTGETNSDGRVTQWRQPNEQMEPYSLDTSFEQLEGELVWQLAFDVGAYWTSRGIRAFFPGVEVRFVAVGSKGFPEGAEREHWHVPLLLGPYSYSTYRGS